MNATKTLTVLAVSVAMAVPAMGGGLVTKQVDGGAGWVLHFDVEAMLRSDLGKFILDEIDKKEEAQSKLADFRKTMGFDPLEAIRGVTLYGPQAGEQAGVAIIDALVDQEKLLSLLQANETYKKLSYGDYVVHQWTDKPRPRRRHRDAEEEPDDELIPGRMHFGCFYDEDTIVIASDARLLERALDVLDGERDSLAKTAALATLPKALPGAFVIAAAEGIKAPVAKHRRGAAMFKNVSAASLQAGEADGTLFADIELITETEKQAAQLRQIIQGFVAFAMMMKQNEEFAPLQELGEKITVGGKGTSATIEAGIPTKSLIEAARFLAEHAKKKRAERLERLRKMRERDPEENDE